MFDAHKQVQSLTTICSPHLGMKLIDLSFQEGENVHYVQNIEKVKEYQRLYRERKRAEKLHTQTESPPQN